MTKSLKVTVGQYSDRGSKEINQDFHGSMIPREPALSAKGVCVALADGISSSDVSQQASQMAVTCFLQDYYCTSDAWSVKQSAHRVLYATNSWLYSQTRQSQYCYEQDRGYVCTFSALVIKSATAHLLHIGDARIYRLRDDALEQLTEDHRYWVSQRQSYLSRALGMKQHIDIDYRSETIEEGDIFILATDGVYEHVDARFVAAAVRENAHDLDGAANRIAVRALELGSDDNLTVQIVRIDELPVHSMDEMCRKLTELPFPPELRDGAEIDGYRIIREIHSSSRSHIYLARDTETGQQLALKTPSIDLRESPSYLESFIIEEWVARRIDSPHVVHGHVSSRPQNYLYNVTEYVEGSSLAQWMTDHPHPDLEVVRNIVDQIVKGLHAFHRLEMLHQDLRPHNILIDHNGTIRIIDFGSVSIAGIEENHTPIDRPGIPGMAQYAAPEYFLGKSGSPKSDLYSLGVIVYQMLTGHLPYGLKVARMKSRNDLNRLSYDSIRNYNREIPAWVDETIAQAVHPDPAKRHGELTEFAYDLRNPSQKYLRRSRPPLLERDPVAFWRGLSLILLAVVAVLAGMLHSH